MYDLRTIDEKESGLNYYPRPQLKRNTDDGFYLNLNGKWDYTITNEFRISDIDNYKFDKIIVPYPLESKLSNVGIRLPKDHFLVYKKEFCFHNKLNRTILHIGACSSETMVFLNNKFLLNNLGGYLPIDIDITDDLLEENVLIIVASNSLNNHYPYGKQKNNNSGIWYTPSTGIWKTVWLESVDDNYIKDLKIKTDINKKELYLKIKSNYNKYHIKVLFNQEIIINDNYQGEDITIKFNDIKLWDTENANLYDLIIENEYDRIESYFGFREIRIENDKVLLNNKRIFMHGLLDQGFYPDSLYSYPNIECVEKELKNLKELGFNTLRKHIKIEDDIWYYYCDKLGIIVWQDFVNMFRYSFFFDSALPTIFSKRIDRIRCYKKKDKDFFIDHSLKTMDLLNNHPSILVWTIFNEGWGQFDTKKVYGIIKKHDDTRIIDSASGWFKVNKAMEVVSDHVYFKKFNIKKKYDKPYFLSEFGGYALKIDGHYYNDQEFGYKKFSNLLDLNTNYYNLYHDEIIPNIKNSLCACIYTQVSDVEDEVNGIFTYDRKVLKINKEIALKIKEEIDEEFNKLR